MDSSPATNSTTGALVARAFDAYRILPVACSSLITLPLNVETYTNSPTATGAEITSASSQSCHSTLPVFRSKAASTCDAVGGRVLPLAAAPAGYDVNTRPLAIVGELVCGSPRNHAHFC